MRIVIIVRPIVVDKIHPPEPSVRFFKRHPVENSLSLRSSFDLIFLEKTRLNSSSSPLSNDIKLDSSNSKSSTMMSTLSSPHAQTNRHYCNHPDCTKVNVFSSRVCFYI